MAKLLATAAILAILYFVVVINAASNCHITTTTTTINEEKTSTSSLKTCQEDINGKDLKHCEVLIAGLPANNDLLSCCQELGAVGGMDCQCVALNEILTRKQQEGHDMEDMLKNAGIVLQYCRMAGCRLGRPALSSVRKDDM